VTATLRDRARAHGLRRASTLAHVALAAVCYVPLLLTAHGRVAADTRQAVYLDPGRFLSDALSMWDPSRDLGTVTHQNIVLVWPMGVYYWFAHALGVPIWLAQRVWLGSVLFLAGAGVLYLARTIRWGTDERRTLVAAGPVVAAFVYAMSPYVLQYATRTSVLLLPWAALPWLIGLTARALESKGWRHPALFALVTLSIAVNATALVLALLGPALWIAWSVWGTRSVTGRDAVKTMARIGAVTAVTSLWWVVALLIEGKYGLPLLNYTETIEQVASTSVATEVLRGLGYWVPYLQQHNYPEVTGAHVYLDNLPVLALQFAVLLVVFVGIVSLRWRHRVYFGALVVIGVAVGIGAYPTNNPSPLSSFFVDFARSSSIGLVLRSTTRAAPIALLGLACLAGAGVDALVRRVRRTGFAVGGVLVVVSIVLAPSIAGADLVDPLYSRPEQLPRYWTDAIAAADRDAGTGRMLEIPGSRFAAYRWGNTYEPITAGLAKTPTAWREQIPYGGAGSADMLVALDNRIQEGLLSPDSLAPVARLLGVSELLVRNDLEYERYDTVTPDRVWSLVEPSPPGLDSPVGFGPVGINEPDPAYARADEPKPADPTKTYPALALVGVKKSRGLVQMVPVSNTVVLDGNGDGIVDAAAGGAIDGTAPVLYAATAASDPAPLDHALDAGARIVLTDTNRRRVERWRSISDTTGITLRADQDPAADNGGPGGEATLDVFPDAGSAWQTVALQQGAKVSATRYGNPLVFEAAFRPAAALDGDPDTAWQVGPTIGGIGDRLTVALDHPIRTDHLTITGTHDNTELTAVDVRLDDGPPIRVELGDESRSPEGQVVPIPEQTFSNVSIEIAGTQTAPGTDPSEVGIAELGIPGVTFDQSVRLPTALVSKLGASSKRVPLSIVLTRQRGDTTKDGGFEEESSIARTFTLPTERAFSITGDARPAAGTGGAADIIDASCRDDLLTVDGRPVPMRLGAVRTNGAYSLEACAPLTLSAGTHELRTAGNAAVDVDQLVLSSSAGGTATPLDAVARPELPPTAPATPVHWTQDSNSQVSVRTTGRSDAPSWLVLGQSFNRGWEASGGHGPDPSGPTLMNGFANAWYVAAPQPAGTAYDVQWTPQRTMDVALLVSLLGVLVALGLVVRGRRWALVAAGDAPALDAPWSERDAVPTRWLVPSAVVLGIVAGLMIGPWWGPVAGAAAYFGGRLRRGHALLTFGALGALAIAFGAVVLDRLGRRHQTAFNFFTSMETAHRFALFALALVAADLLFSWLRPAIAPHDPVGDVARWRSRLAARAAILLPPVEVREERADQDDAPEPPTAVRAAADADADADADSSADAAPSTPRPPSAARRFALAWSAGGVAGALLFVWMATRGTFDLFRWHPTADFYDAQAHQLLAGHLDVPKSVLGIEAFVVDGKSYMYQGPWPAILRLPVVAFTHGLDGRLATISMLVAFVVATAALGTLTWQLRSLVRPGAAVSRAEAWAMGAFAFACSGGSVMVFEASQISVYHESAMWGIAMALATMVALVRHLVRPGRATVGVASALATLTLFSRASLGLGMMVALGLVFLGELVAWWQERRDRAVPRWSATLRPARIPAARKVVLALVACVAPVLLYSSLNVAKFGTPLSVPWEKQVFTEVSSARRDFLAENGNTFFGAQFVPTTLVAYLRPDAFRFDDQFPYLGFNPSMIGRETGLAGVRFDKIDATGSIPVSFPLLTVLGVVGAVGIVAARRRRPRLVLVTGPLVGAAASAATIFVFGFIAQRYLGDALPFLAACGAAGFVLLTDALPRVSRPARRATVAVVVVLGLVATWVTFAQGLWYQRVFQSPTDETATEQFVRTRTDLAQLPGLSTLTPVTQGEHVPTRGDPGDLFVVGDCDGLYVSSGATVDELSHTNWQPVARTPGVGAYDLEVTFPADVQPGTRDPLLVSGTADHPNVLGIEYLDADHARIFYSGAGLPGNGPTVHITPGKTYRVHVSADPETDFSLVTLDDRTIWSGVYTADDLPTLAVNHLDSSTRARFGGTIHQLPESKDLCRAVLARDS
jgi:Alpha-(1->3)-arabinofuranosyltransferase